MASQYVLNLAKESKLRFENPRINLGPKRRKEVSWRSSNGFGPFILITYSENPNPRVHIHASEDNIEFPRNIFHIEFGANGSQIGPALRQVIAEDHRTGELMQGEENPIPPDNPKIKLIHEILPHLVRQILERPDRLKLARSPSFWETLFHQMNGNSEKIFNMNRNHHTSVRAKQGVLDIFGRILANNEKPQG